MALTIILTGPHPRTEGMTAQQINAARYANGAVALTMLPSLILALERAAALLPDQAEQARAYQEASRARALLAETP